MKKHPRTFDPLFTNMIAAGEAGGILDTILKRLATYIEKAVKLKGQVKSAMIYPVAIITIAVVVVGVILWKVIPTFAALFSGLGAQLPLPTRVVIALSNFLVAFMPFIIVGIGAVGYAFKAYHDTVGGKYNIDKIVLKLPVLGLLMRKIAVARFCRTLSTLRPRACLFSTVSTSPRARRGTRSSRKRFFKRGRASSAARRSRRH